MNKINVLKFCVILYQRESYNIQWSFFLLEVFPIPVITSYDPLCSLED